MQGVGLVDRSSHELFYAMCNGSGHAAREAVKSHDVSMALGLGFFVLPSWLLLMADRGSYSHKERGVEGRAWLPDWGMCATSGQLLSRNVMF